MFVYLLWILYYEWGYFCIATPYGYVKLVGNKLQQAVYIIVVLCMFIIVFIELNIKLDLTEM